MQPVEDDAGHRYLLLERSSDGWLVRDPATGDERTVAPAELTPLEEPPLETAADAVPASVRTLLGAVHDDRGLGLVVTVVDDGPVGVRRLLDATALCESDLHGLLAELQAAGLFEEARIAGERGYEATDECEEAVAWLRVGSGDGHHEQS